MMLPTTAKAKPGPKSSAYGGAQEG